MSNPTLNPVLKTFWKTRTRNRVLYGGRSSSKSWDAAGMAICLAQYTKLKILCIRQFQNKIEESVYSLLKIQIERFGLKHDFEILKNKIRCRSTGSEFIFYGMARNFDEIKSTESVDICWIEEAHSLREDQWRDLNPTIRKENSQIWIVFNPQYTNDFVYQRFVINPPADTIKRLINYDENGFLSQTMIKLIEDAKQEDAEEFGHIYLGQPRDDDDMVIIKRSWIESAIDAHKHLNMDFTGAKNLGYDVADSGQDKNAIINADGSLCTYIYEWKAAEDELLKSCGIVHDYAKKHGSFVIYDSIGVGAHVGSTLKGMSFANYAKFNAGGAIVNQGKVYSGKTTNKEAFSNLKAQAWQLVADRFRNTHNAVQRGEKFNADDMISIDSKCDSIERLVYELSTPYRDFDNQGRLKVESKKDLAKRDIKSPNLADAFIMAYSKGLVKRGGNMHSII